MITAVIGGSDATSLVLPVTTAVGLLVWIVTSVWAAAMAWSRIQRRLDDAERERKAMRRQLEGLDRRKRPRAGEGVWP
ncbi:MAG: hypothetical protein AAGI68_14265 [Planctomycetota bacterium]